MNKKAILIPILLILFSMVVSALIPIGSVFDEGISSTDEGSRSSIISKPRYDGLNDNFQLDLISKQEGTYGGNYVINVKVSNPGSATGSNKMNVECGILDLSTNTWLNSVSRQLSFSEGAADLYSQNCVAGETNMQTYEASVVTGGSIELPFNIVAPLKGEMTQPVIYCAAFEQCGTDGPSYTSSTFVHTSVTLTETATCSDECSNSGLFQCQNGIDSIMQCANWDSDPCLELKAVQDCTEGCQDGACVRPQNRCTDSDDLNYETLGQIDLVDYYGNPSTKTDYCLDNTRLNEYRCISSNPGSITYTCPEGCQDGACITTDVPPVDTTLPPNTTLPVEPIDPGTVTTTTPLSCQTCDGVTSGIPNIIEIASGTRTSQVQPTITWWEKLFGINAGRQTELSTTTICEEVRDVSGSTYFSLQHEPTCINEQPIRTPEYFKPRPIKMWVKNIESTGLFNPAPGGEWIEIVDGNIPQSLSAKWNSGSYVQVAVEFTNDRATPFRMPAELVDTIGRPKGEAEKFIALIEGNEFPLEKWQANLISDTSIGTLDKLSMWFSGKEIDQQGLEELQLKYLEAADYLNIGIYEIGIYSKDASVKAYSNVYSSRQGTGLPTLGIPTLGQTNSCQGNEDVQGWIKHFSVLTLPPMYDYTTGQNVCLPFNEYDSPAEAYQYRLNQLGGTCNPVITTVIKVPEPGDFLGLSETQGISNWDVNGEYVLHAAAFDRCDRADAPTQWWDQNQQIQYNTLKIATEENLPVCCKVEEKFGYTTEFDSTTYIPMTTSECSSYPLKYEHAIITSIEEDVSKCENFQPITCYYCDFETKGVLTATANGNSCSLFGSGWVESKEKANQQCAIIGQPVNCYTCDNLVITKEERSTCDNSIGEFEAEDKKSGCEAALPDVVFDWTDCYECLADGTSRLAKDSFGEIINVNGENTCWGKGLLSFEQTPQCADLGVLTSKINTLDSTESEFCTYIDGIKSKCYPRKDVWDINDIDLMKDLDFEKEKRGDDEFLGWKDYPLCYDSLGNIQCQDGGECLPAINSRFPENKENLKIYNLLEDKIFTASWYQINKASWWSEIFKDEVSEEITIEQFGVCVDEQRDFLENIKEWIARAIGVDPDDPIVSVILFGGAALILFIVFKITTPPQQPTRRF